MNDNDETWAIGEIMDLHEEIRLLRKFLEANADKLGVSFESWRKREIDLEIEATRRQIKRDW